jgi:hypothetical protein
MDSLAQLLARPSLPLSLVEQPILLRGPNAATAA